MSLPECHTMSFTPSNGTKVNNISINTKSWLLLLQKYIKICQIQLLHLCLVLSFDKETTSCYAATHSPVGCHIVLKKQSSKPRVLLDAVGTVTPSLLAGVWHKRFTLSYQGAVIAQFLHIGYILAEQREVFGCTLEFFTTGH